jgi:hypothetical protein
LPANSFAPLETLTVTRGFQNEKDGAARDGASVQLRLAPLPNMDCLYELEQSQQQPHRNANPEDERIPYGFVWLQLLSADVSASLVPAEPEGRGGNSKNSNNKQQYQIQIFVRGAHFREALILAVTVLHCLERQAFSKMLVEQTRRRLQLQLEQVNTRPRFQRFFAEMIRRLRNSYDNIALLPQLWPRNSQRQQVPLSRIFMLTTKNDAEEEEQVEKSF